MYDTLCNIFMFDWAKAWMSQISFFTSIRSLRFSCLFPVCCSPLFYWKLDPWYSPLAHKNWFNSNGFHNKNLRSHILIHEENEEFKIRSNSMIGWNIALFICFFFSSLIQSLIDCVFCAWFHWWLCNTRMWRRKKINSTLTIDVKELQLKLVRKMKRSHSKRKTIRSARRL